ncbi:MAG: DUF3341 domain-containing protein [Phycisphaerales bacterium]|nr:DUF3341 domain-containing protein [Phycisphaerales bacterium]
MGALLGILHRMGAHHYCPLVPAPPPRFVTERGCTLHGIMGEFDTAQAVYAAAEKVRDAGYRRWDVHTPFPIHGMEDAMGVKPTRLPILIALGAFTGVGGAYLMQWWMGAVDYPMVVQGKPYAAWEPWVPIMFELGVLCSAFSALLGMLGLNGLPRHHHPLFTSERFLRSSQDRFFVVIEAEDQNFNPQRVRSLLESSGATHVELVEDDSVEVTP